MLAWTHEFHGNYSLPAALAAKEEGKEEENQEP